MRNTCALAVGLFMAAVTSLGCNKSGLPGPTQILSLTSMLPNSGLTTIAYPVKIFGTGFKHGATVTVDNVQINSTVVSDRIISATMPIHDVGTVDIVVTNPGGQSARLSPGFTFGVFTLVSSTGQVTAGASLSVSWVNPGPRFQADWVGFFKVGEPSTNYESRWWVYTFGANTGTLSLTAPAEPGQYEFRYLLADGYDEAGRSNPVTVTAGASSSASRLSLGARAGGK